MDELDIAGEVFRTTCLEYADSQGIAPEVVSYVEQVTTDQSANDLWKALYNGRITSSSFHDVLVRKTTTAPDSLVKKLMGYTSFHGTPATRYGLTHEDPARQQYVAFMNKTGHQGISVTPSGLSLVFTNNLAFSAPLLTGTSLIQQKKTLEYLRSSVRFQSTTKTSQEYHQSKLLSVSQQSFV